MTELLRTGPDFDRVILRREALAAGYSESAIVALSRSGEWVRLRHGAYTDRESWESRTPEQRHALVARAVLKQGKTALVLSHTTAAVGEYDAPVFGVDLSQVHATRQDRRAGRVEAGVHQHQGLLLPGDVVRRNGVDVTSGTKTALDVTTQLSVEASLAIVCHLLHQAHTDQDALAARYALMDKDPNTLRTDLVLRLASPKIQSIGEARTFFWCWKGGLPRPEPQWEVQTSGRTVAYLDLAWPAHKKWLEFDGKFKYTKFLKPGQSIEDAMMAEKAREKMIRQLTGWTCLRITWEDLENPERLIAMIREFLASP